jgi:hypothetical protein
LEPRWNRQLDPRTLLYTGNIIGGFGLLVYGEAKLLGIAPDPIDAAVVLGGTLLAVVVLGFAALFLYASQRGYTGR